MALRPILLALLMLLAPLSGCIGSSTMVPDDDAVRSPFSFEFSNLTSYHFPGSPSSTEAIDATTATDLWVNLTGNNTPISAEATYYGIGHTTFEPTIGVTSDGTIVFTNYGGTGTGTQIIRSMDQGQTWENVGPFNPVFPVGQVPTSNDPYLYVDRWTDRIVKFDMHALVSMFYEFSDDGGQTWSAPIPVEGYYSPQDHQSIASMPPPDGVNAMHETIQVFCINTGSSALGPQCSRSLNGGLTWDVQRPGYPVGVPQCSGLHAHLAGSPDGSIYRGNPSCSGPAVYRSIDGGYSWTEHTITTEVGMQDGWHSHEVATATDDAGGLHALWIGDDAKPWYANSMDRGETWSTPMMVAPPTVTHAGFPTIYAGAEGRVAFGYIGNVTSNAWNGYLGVMTDAFHPTPLITTTQVNAHEDPLDETPDCYDVRCGGFGDFIDIELDDEGRPWLALAHNPVGEIGIVGTYVTGPSLYGDLGALPTLPRGEPLG